MAKNQATEEQIKYAGMLDKGMKIGFVLVVVSFILYITGIMAPYLPINDLPKYWGMPVHDYLKATNIHMGWAWLGMLQKGDFINFIGIAFLAGVTIPCYIAIMPIFLKKKDKVYFTLALLEVTVLALAASGLLKSGGH
ncbi:MAG: hypothetical protein Q8J64_03835 [Thermodesulfovibrionales bacterium]|nr:hypothetical protein [Thermodesulfovibrionales bacterium]